MKTYNMLGIHAANIDGVPAFIAKVAEMVCSRIYVKDSPNPIPRYIPMPPLRLRDESDAPIMVNINDANDVAIRL